VPAVSVAASAAFGSAYAGVEVAITSYAYTCFDIYVGMHQASSTKLLIGIQSSGDNHGNVTTRTYPIQGSDSVVAAGNVVAVVSYSTTNAACVGAQAIYASGGSVTLTSVGQSYTGSFEATFAEGQVSGTFHSLPTCFGPDADLQEVGDAGTCQ
jgi:hypothetical protein